jgi:hypothetical protein
MVDLAFYSRALRGAKRAGEIQRRRGVTFQGQKLWEQWEDEIVRQMSHSTISETRKSNFRIAPARPSKDDENI